jgi:two-component system chemotaxis sensor kinase CheA
MNVDMSQFFQLFFEESAEHLAEFERIFLAIDPADPDEEDLNAVFRAAHSIKGGAGTFGLPDMGMVAHTLESLLDLVRHHKMPLTKEMVDLFLQAGDAINMQLAGHRDASPVDLKVIENVCGRLSTISAGSASSLSAGGPVAATSIDHAKNDPAAVRPATYRILFTPPPDLYVRMVRMEPIFAELAAMGVLTLTAGIGTHLEFHNYDPTRCEAFWEMTLITDRTPDDIREVSCSRRTTKRY